MIAKSQFLRGTVLISCAGVFLAGALFMWALTWWSHLSPTDPWQPLLSVGLLIVSAVMFALLPDVTQTSLASPAKTFVRITIALGALMSALAVVVWLLFAALHSSELGQLSYALGGIASASLGIGSTTLGAAILRTAKPSQDTDIMA